MIYHFCSMHSVQSISYRVSRITNNPSFIIKNFIWLSLYCKRLHIFKVTNFFFFLDDTFDYDETFRTGTNSFDGIRCDIVFHWSLLCIVFSRNESNFWLGKKFTYFLFGCCGQLLQTLCHVGQGLLESRHHMSL